MTSDATRRNGEIVTATGFALHLAGVSKTYRPGNAELITAVDDASLDLAAAEYRAWLFGHAGFALWDAQWYGGHHLPGYSLLSPPLGALIGVRLAGALSAGAHAATTAAAAEPPRADFEVRAQIDQGIGGGGGVDRVHGVQVGGLHVTAFELNHFGPVAA